MDRGLWLKKKGKWSRLPVLALLTVAARCPAASRSCHHGGLYLDRCVEISPSLSRLCQGLLLQQCS